MKTNVKLLLMFFVIILITIGHSCDKDDDDCPDRMFDTLADCEDATDGKKCICIKEGDKWEAIYNP